MSWQSSTRTPPDDFGCKNAILLLSAPSFGLLCMSSNPSFNNLFISTSILSTSKGVLSDNEARTEKVGGEILCKVF